MSIPGWYPDPAGAQGRFRFWDGQAWSSVTTTNPADPAPGGDRDRPSGGGGRWWMIVAAVVGVLLLVPPVREWAKAHLMRTTESALRRRGVSVVTVTDATGVRRATVVPGDVIGGEVVEESGSSPDTPTDRGSSPNPGPPNSGPRVVRGEIAGTE